MLKNLKIGDKAWISSCGQKQVKVECPSCCGKKFITLILGNEERVTMDCDFCGGKTFDGPLGYTLEYKWIAEPEEIMVTKVKMEQDSNGIKFSYYNYDNREIEDLDVFATMEEALDVCQEKIKEHEQQEIFNIKNKKEYANKSYSWAVGYHKKQIKENERQLEYHKTKLDAAKLRAKK